MPIALKPPTYLPASAVSSGPSGSRGPAQAEGLPH